MNESASPKRVSTLAAIAFVSAWIPVLFVPAFVLAVIARREIRAHQETMRGKGLTTAGMLLAAMTPLLLILMNVAYKRNLEHYHFNLSSARAALEGRLTNRALEGLFSKEDTRQLMADIRRMESNPPSFFNPFDL